MLTLRIHMEFTQQTIEEAAVVLRTLIGPVRSEAGCSATRLSLNADNARQLTWVEEWRGREDFERHLRDTDFRQILAVIELAAGPPVVEIDDVVSRQGFELIEEILGCAGAEFRLEAGG